MHTHTISKYQMLLQLFLLEGMSKTNVGYLFSYRSAHDNLCSLLQSFGLLPHAASSINRHRTQRVGFPKTLAFCMNLAKWHTRVFLETKQRSFLDLTWFLPNAYLLTKLSGGTHNDGDGPFPCLQFLLIHDVNKHGPDKSSSLTTASFCNSYHVSSRKSYGQTLKAKLRIQKKPIFLNKIVNKKQTFNKYNTINVYYTWHWMGVGWVYSDLRIWCISCSSKLKWAKLVQGFGGTAPDTWKRRSDEEMMMMTTTVCMMNAHVTFTATKERQKCLKLDWGPVYNY